MDPVGDWPSSPPSVWTVTLVKFGIRASTGVVDPDDALDSTAPGSGCCNCVRSVVLRMVRLLRVLWEFILSVCRPIL